VNEGARGFCVFASKTQQREKEGFFVLDFFSFIYIFIYLVSLVSWDGDGGILVFTFFLAHIPLVRVWTQHQF